MNDSGKSLPVTLQEKLVICLILLFALISCLPYFFRGFNYDELFMLNHYIRQPNLFDALFKNYWLTNHIGYTALAYVNCRLFGISEWTMRLPSLFFGFGSIVLLWYWARRHFGRTVALLAAFLLALSPALIIWESIARGYSAMVFFTLLSSVIYFKLLRSFSWKLLAVFVLTNIVGISFHLFFLAVICMQAGHIVWMGAVQRKRVGAIAGAIALTFFLPAMCFLPLMGKAIFHLKGTNSSYVFSLNFPQTTFSELLCTAWFPLGVVAVLLMFLGLILGRPEGLVSWQVYGVLAILSFLSIWLIQLPFLVTRFFAYLLPFIFLFISTGTVACVQFFSGHFKWGVKIFLCVILLFFIWTGRTQPGILVNEELDEFKEAARFAQTTFPNGRFCSFGQDE